MNLSTVFSNLPFPPPPRPDLLPLPHTIPLTVSAALLPPFFYFLAAFLLPPFSPPPSSSTSTSTSTSTSISVSKHNFYTNANTLRSLIAPVRNTLALSSAILFFRLPLRYHVPFSVGLTYQLCLVGIYGGCRVVDAFLISLYLFNHVPQRVKYRDDPRRHEEGEGGDSSGVHEDRESGEGKGTKRSLSSSSSSTTIKTLHRVLSPSQGAPVTEDASTAPPHVHGFLDRASFALELELSMRGAGFTWTSADVRHTKRTWRPTAADRAHSITVHVLPTLLGGWALIQGIWSAYLDPALEESREAFDDMPFLTQITLTAAVGTFLLAAFSLGHSVAAIALNPLSPHPLAFFPPLYSARVWQITSVRMFWSYGWHRLFSRLFLVYGVWPGEWVGRKLCRVFRIDSDGGTGAAVVDVGKVLGAFASSAIVHALAGRVVLGGKPWGGSGEAIFFISNGVAVIVEEGVKKFVMQRRKRTDGKENGGLERWYDGVVGRIWWVSVLLYSGRNFARGWTEAGLITEMAGA